MVCLVSSLWKVGEITGFTDIHIYGLLRLFALTGIYSGVQKRMYDWTEEYSCWGSRGRGGMGF